MQISAGIDTTTNKYPLVFGPRPIPHACPICQGRGTMAKYFYQNELPAADGNAESVPCRSCGGGGIVWG